MAKLEEVGSKPEVNPGTKPRVHLREPHSATASTSTSTTPTTNAFPNGNSTDNLQSSSAVSASTSQPPIGQQQQQWSAVSATKPPPGFKLAYAYVPDGTTLPRKLDSETTNILRAFGTGVSLKENRPPPLPPKPKSEASAPQVPSALSEMMALISKQMASSLFQSEKMLSNAVQAPENGFYNIYCETADRFLDLDSSNTKEGTSIIAWPHIFAHNPAQTVRKTFPFQKISC